MSSSISGATASVTKSAATLVKPCCEQTPSGFLPLSSIDKLPSMRFWADTLHAFKHGQEPAKVLKEAISKALVFYYPLAGRLIETDDDELQVTCTGDGVWFVEAQANCRLEDVNHLQRPLVIPVEDLLPPTTLSQGQMVAPLMLQVTEFKCGGFAVGTRYNHTITDGVGLAQFLKAVGELARGLKRPTIEPIWCRECIPTPPNVPKQGQLPALPNLNLEYSVLDIPRDHIDRLMHQVPKETGTTCSTFDVLAAKLWQSRTRAINSDPDVPVLFSFTANVRPILQQMLPTGGGYYGNCIYIAHVTALSGRIANAPIGEVVGLIRETKGRLPDEFEKWGRGELAQSPFESRNTYNMMHLTDWRHIGFAEVDYGWGQEMHSGAMIMRDSVAMGIVTRPSTFEHGARLTARYVREEHLAAFHDQIKSVS